MKEKTAIHHNNIYVTGTFNNWDSTASKKYLMQPYGVNEKSITLSLKAGSISYKFTRGNWFTVEKTNYGGEVPNRVINISKDTTLIDSVVAWRDLVITDREYALSREKEDTSKVKILANIADLYAFQPEYYNVDSALYYTQKALALTHEIKNSGEYKSWIRTGYSEWMINIQEITATLLDELGNYPKALEIRFENLNIAENAKNKRLITEAMANITLDYSFMKDYQKVLYYGKQIDSIVNTANINDLRRSFAKYNTEKIIATAYYNLGAPDSALDYAKKMMAFDIKNKSDLGLVQEYLLLAGLYSEKGEDTLAFSYYRKAIPLAKSVFAQLPIARVHEGLARLFQKTGQLDSALRYARLSLAYYQNNKIDVQSWGDNADTHIAELSPLIAELYKDNHQLDSAYKYLHLSVVLRDSLFNINKIRQFQTLTFNEATRRQQLEQATKEARHQYATKIKFYILSAITAVFLIIAFLLLRNNRNKRKTNELLHKKNEEIETQRDSLETTLSDLKSTQKQLIQSEKMASLGELMAGIAHEIQNPLNFVNNFSDVNQELIEEMDQEIDKGNIEEVKSIAKDIKENEGKINHHGKRADAIVKGMLQHSRVSRGVKEPTDINALADEYLRLSYHGLRAKNKDFNAKMETNFDISIGKINIIPQDFGRVLLNLYNNAFYACTERSRSIVNQQNSKNLISNAQEVTPFQKVSPLYEPTVSVTTKKSENHVLITVTDNGNGIPQKIVDKIFQPFFTTKPTGQGTGLGLSLSYDIIKAQGGEIKVESKENEGTIFTIQLPITSSI
ncbi:MAG: ATP-binding protein [Ginsengibacter sp.]